MQDAGEADAEAERASSPADPREPTKSEANLSLMSSCSGKDWANDGVLGVQIICVGLMRTGLKSLHEALDVLGHGPIYDQEQIVSTFELWNDVMRNNCAQEHTFRNIFQGAKVAMGMPTFVFWEHVLELNPHAKVILTIRDEDEWFKSVLRAKTMMDNDMPGAPLCHGSMMQGWEAFLAPSYHKFCEVLRFAWSVTLGGLPMRGQPLNEAVVRSSYRKHNVYVQEKLRGKSTPKGQQQLLVYNVHEGWGPLCDFLGVDIPSQDFPAVMEVPYFPGQQQGVLTDPEGFAMDLGQEFEGLLVPDSDFGVRMRRELRRGLTVAAVVLALLVVPIMMAVRFSQFVQGLLALFVIVLLAIAWEVYVVMHTVVMRVPALVVLPLIMKSLLIATCLQACFITYGFLKEQMVTQDRVAAPLLILSARLMSVACGMFAVYMQEGRIHFGGVPLKDFVPFGVTNEGSTWAGYEMLKYVSFPVHVMAKSCTLLPSMLMGRLLNGTSYRWGQYIQAVGAMVCVTIMHLSEGQKENGRHKQAGDSEMGDVAKALCGVGLLVLFFSCDSFTSQWQTSLYQKHPRLTKTQMMVCGNLTGLCITLVSITLQWGKVRESIDMVLADRAVLGRLVLLGLCAAMGQFCIYTAIKTLGALAFTWIMTTRQLLSVLISLVLFGHGVSITKLVCIIVVFAIMSSKQLVKAGSAFKKRAKCKARSASRGSSGMVHRNGGQDFQQWQNEQATSRAAGRTAANGHAGGGGDASSKKEE